MNASVIIPSNRSEVLTVDSIPEDFADVQVRREEGLNRARNAGVQSADHNTVVIADDDLVFDGDWFREHVRRSSVEMTIHAAAGTGILPMVEWPVGFEPGLGRMMIFSKDAWRAAGGFPVPCSHGGDTDFMMSAYEAGYNIETFAHKWEHRDDDIDDYSLIDHLSWLWFLFRRHPGLVGPRLPALAYQKVVG